MLKRENIDCISKAITRFAFRDGPIENMHAINQLSEDDMKTLNIYMVNRLAGILTAIADDNWLGLEELLSSYKIHDTQWDVAVPDMEQINLSSKIAIEKNQRFIQKQLNDSEKKSE